MVSNVVKERLLQRGWYVVCETMQDVDLVLQACDDVGITCSLGGKATELVIVKQFPLCIEFSTIFNGITYGCSDDYYGDYENITDWFFNAIKNTDNKLTPQNAKQRHLVQIILARSQGIPLEVYSKEDNKWIDASNTCSMSIECEYRIKLTPLPISRELWGFIDKDFRFCVMDRFGLVLFYKERPELYENGWRIPNKPDDSNGCLAFPLYINTQGIYWKTSLTERPEGV